MADKFKYEFDINDAVTNFMEIIAKDYDLTTIKHIRFARAKYSHGTCYYAGKFKKMKRERKQYRINCWIPENLDRYFERSVLKWKQIYIGKRSIIATNIKAIPKTHNTRNSQGIYKWIFEKIVKDEPDKKIGMYKVYKIVADEVEEVTLKSLDELIIFIYGHELYHFLRKTKQIGGRNTQNQADGFGIKLVKNWREIS